MSEAKRQILRSFIAFRNMPIKSWSWTGKMSRFYAFEVRVAGEDGDLCQCCLKKRAVKG